MKLLPLALALASTCALAAEFPPPIDARLLQTPAVSATQLAFAYAGDIWIAPKSGGLAVRLSTPRGTEQFPRFSPDGTRLAFSGNYEGDVDLYTLPVTGGEPLRLTHHGADDRMLGWAPDGQSILFASKMQSFTERVHQLFRVPATGGLPERLPVPYGEFGALSPDGKRLAYTMIDTSFATWKRYRGGMAPDLWIYDLEKGTAEVVASDPANDSQPMWHGATLYFLSDRGPGARANLWNYDPATRQVRQVTRFTDYDVHFPSIGPAEIVFESHGQLHLLDLATEQLREVEITLVTDRATLRPRVVNVGSEIRDGTLTPTGRRVVFEARGDLFSAPVEHGVVRNLTDSSGVAERHPAASPDGKWIAYFSDRPGEYELHLRPADGRGAEQQITRLGPGYRYQPQWSPDAKKLVFIDQTMRIHLCDLAAKKSHVVGQQLWMYQGELARFAVSWSADSRYFAYAADQENRHTAIAIVDTVEKKMRRVTSGYYDEDLPVFDPAGKYLYYRAKRWFDPLYSELDNSWIYANGQALVAVSLQAGTPSPLAPRNDEEPVKKSEPAAPPKEQPAPAEPPKPPATSPERKDEPPPGDARTAQTAIKPEPPATPLKPADPAAPPKPAPPTPAAPKPVTIDFAGIEARGVILPPGGGRFAWLGATPGRLLFTRAPRLGSGTSAFPLSAFDFEKREEKLIADDAPGLELSADGKRLLIRKGNVWRVIGSTEAPKFDKTIGSAGSLEVRIDPLAEWRQIFTDAWRIERDFFYDPKMHGVDWPAQRERYGRLIESCATRSDVNYVLGELLGELNSSHTYRSGGDLQDTPPTRNVGYLGCDFTLEQGAYRLARILETAPWDLNLRSPLRQPGLKVKEGDWLLAVNGRPLDVRKDPWAAFLGLADRPVFLTVNDRPVLEGAREILVNPIGNESELRRYAWIERNRRRVDQASGGQIGYIYVLNTATEGQNQLVRQFHAQLHKAGLIIDERWNSGGQIPDRFVELLARRPSNYYAVRDGRDWQSPAIAHAGPKAMLANGWSGSGGDCFPFLFRQMKLGPVIGTRTWGGLIGMTGAPRLIDGGEVTVPTFAIYDRSGQWIIEGHGVDPDIAVPENPAELERGLDAQLERAIAEVQQALKAQPVTAPKKPEYPVR